MGLVKLFVFKSDSSIYITDEAVSKKEINTSKPLQKRTQTYIVTPRLNVTP